MGEWNELVANLPGLAGGGMRDKREDTPTQFRSHDTFMLPSPTMHIPVPLASSSNGRVSGKPWKLHKSATVSALCPPSRPPV